MFLDPRSLDESGSYLLFIPTDEPFKAETVFMEFILTKLEVTAWIRVGAPMVVLTDTFLFPKNLFPVWHYAADIEVD